MLSALMKLICALILIVSNSWAKADSKNWQNEIDLGMLVYNGNNNAKHLNGSLFSGYQHVEIENNFKVTGLLAVGKNTQTKFKERNAEKYSLTDTIQYVFSEKHFAYLSGKAVRDHFSAYAYEFTESAGYGYSLFDSNAFVWKLSGGPGNRQSKVYPGMQQRELIGHLESELFYQITSHSSFKQSVIIDTSALNTKSITLNELKTAVFGPVAAKFTYELEHNSDLPVPSKYSKKTDAMTKITLSYSF